MIYRVTLLIFTLGLLAGCAGTGDGALPEARTFTKEEIAAMPLETRLAEYNRTRPKEEQLVCRRDFVTGSHQKTTRCITLAQMAEEQEAARDYLRKHKGVVFGQ